MNDDDKYSNYEPNRPMEPLSPKNKDPLGRLVKFIFIATIIFILLMSLISVAFVKRRNISDHYEETAPIAYTRPARELNEELYEFDTQYEDNDRLLNEDFTDYDAQEMNVINIDVLSANIEISTGNYSKIDFKLDNPENYSVQSNGSSLTLSENDFMSSIGSNDKICINLPESQLASLNIKTMSGSIEIEGVDSDEFTLDSNSGNIKLKDSDANSLVITTISGNVSVEDSDSLNFTDINSTSGEINLTNFKTDNAIYLQSLSGEIKCSNTDTTYLIVNTVSGGQNIEINKQNDLNVDLTAISGDIKCTFDNKQKINNIGNHGTRGDFSFDFDSPNTFTTSTISGKITVNNK